MMREYAKAIGFKEMPHMTIGNSLIYDLGRRRRLSFSDVGGGNEMLSITSHSPVDHRRIEDVVIIHNRDYDGLMTQPRLLEIVSALAPAKTNPK